MRNCLWTTARLAHGDATMAGMDLARLRRIAQRQLGLFTRFQATECGASRSLIGRRLRSGEWQRVLGPVLATPEVRRTPGLIDRAAVMAVPGGVLVGPSAARAWRLPVPDPRTYLAIGDRRVRLTGLRLLRYEVPRRDLARHQGLLVTSRRCAVIDSLRILPESAARELLDRSLHERWLITSDITTFIQANLGRPGTPQLRRLVRGTSDGTRFEAERRTAALLRKANITGWVANAPVYDEAGLIGFADFLFEAEHLVIEIDGLAYHSSTGQFQRDRHRQNRLVATGWRVLRFTWIDITDRPEYVVAAIRAMLGS